MKKPNLFLVGAPKCGTTSLYRYLKGHPEVYFPDKKLFQQFCTDLHFDRPRLTREEYLAYYAPATDQKYLGDASTFHLYSREAARNIREFAPRARIVILLRDPCEMLYSLHGELLFNGEEDIADFEEALDAEGTRKADPDRAFTWKREALYYSEIGRFSEQVERYLDEFERESVQIVLFDDLKADPLGTYRQLLRFLEIDDGHVPPMKVHNPSKVARSAWVSGLLGSRRFRAVARACAPTAAREKIHAMLNRLNARTAARPPLPARVRRKILGMYPEEGDRLSALIGRDVRHWYHS